MNTTAIKTTTGSLKVTEDDNTIKITILDENGCIAGSLQLAGAAIKNLDAILATLK